MYRYINSPSCSMLVCSLALAPVHPYMDDPFASANAQHRKITYTAPTNNAKLKREEKGECTEMCTHMVLDRARASAHRIEKAAAAAVVVARSHQLWVQTTHKHLLFSFRFSMVFLRFFFLSRPLIIQLGWHNSFNVHTWERIKWRWNKTNSVSWRFFYLNKAENEKWSDRWRWERQIVHSGPLLSWHSVISAVKRETPGWRFCNSF